MVIVILSGALHLAGCTDTPSDPGFDEMPPMEDVEIEMATDPDLTASLIEDIFISMTPNMTTGASVKISTAEGLFSQARVELTRGEYERVRSLIVEQLGVDESQVTPNASFADDLNADSLGYLSQEGMVKATKLPADGFCMACYDGKYPVEYDPTVDKHIMERRRARVESIGESLAKEEMQPRLL